MRRRSGFRLSLSSPRRQCTPALGELRCSIENFVVVAAARPPAQEVGVPCAPAATFAAAGDSNCSDQERGGGVGRSSSAERSAPGRCPRGRGPATEC